MATFTLSNQDGIVLYSATAASFKALASKSSCFCPHPIMASVSIITSDGQEYVREPAIVRYEAGDLDVDGFLVERGDWRSASSTCAACGVTFERLAHV